MHRHENTVLQSQCPAFEWSKLKDEDLMKATFQKLKGIRYGKKRSKKHDSK